MKDDNTPPSLSAVRNHGLSYEANLDPQMRKLMGQYFSGLPLSRILAALSLRKGHSNIIDPMAGHGDLLDAIFERSEIMGNRLDRVDAIEIDGDTASECVNRLRPWKEQLEEVVLTVMTANAFTPDIIKNLPHEGYDLVITNPPYVRYQMITRDGNFAIGNSSKYIREALLSIIHDRAPPPERGLWRNLVRSYSGLSDLSVPCWILAAILVKPGGTLALVAPATWRNRDYADVIQYLLGRCFSLEIVVADRQPGWFSDALVRTNLIVARRLDTKIVVQPIFCRSPEEHKIIWVEIDTCAKRGNSLIGRAFGSSDPEGEFTRWISEWKNGINYKSSGVFVSKRRDDGILNLLSSRRSVAWLKRLEPINERNSLYSQFEYLPKGYVPDILKDIFPNAHDLNLHWLSELGINACQGLRTGCNGFFYVELIEKYGNQMAKVRTSKLLGGNEIILPRHVLIPVLRRQSELNRFIKGESLQGHVLDLNDSVLPEDMDQVTAALPIYERNRIKPPKEMPDELAYFVRKAANTYYNNNDNKIKKLIPELTAVRTNISQARNGPKPRIPRFWYMLPTFTQRHHPVAFVPRINDEPPRVLLNRNPPVLIDANFSTFLVDDENLSKNFLIGIMNSTWTRTCMEAIGTPMGGGALKLEATHLRRLTLPIISDEDKIKIIKIIEHGKSYQKISPNELMDIDIIIMSAIFNGRCGPAQINKDIIKLKETMEKLNRARLG